MKDLLINLTDNPKTKPHIMKANTILVLPFFALLLSSCGESETSSVPAPTPDPAVAAVISTEEPVGAISVVEARKSAKPGDEITVSGIIAGTAHPFTDGFASVVLGDAAMETCNKVPGDECPMPWDACCADPEVLKGQRLTLQILDPDGTPVAQGLKGIFGLVEMDQVVATGRVTADSNAENLVVNVTRLYRKSKS